MIVVLTTTPNIEDAEKLAKQIVEARLAACVQVVPGIKSFYYWEGEVQKESEHLLLIKTLDKSFAELEVFIRSNHNYDVPEIVALSAKGVSESYLKWLTDYIK